MRFHIVLSLGIILSVLTGPCLADGRAFPPDNCSEQTPFMAFTAIQNSNTYCTNGQTIFRNALPDCGLDEFVAFDGTQFICKPASTQSLTIPNCAADQVLTSSGGTLSCVAANSTATISQGSLCGMAANSGSPSGCAASTNGYTSIATCNGQSVANSCPTGYTRKTIESTHLTTCGGDGGSCFNYDCIRTCIKD